MATNRPPQAAASFAPVRGSTDRRFEAAPVQPSEPRETAHCWIHPDKIRRSWARRNDERLDSEWRDYHRGIVRLGIQILKERREMGL